MLKLLLFCATVLTAVQANGELSLLQIPSSLEFIAQNRVEQSSLKNLLAGLGYTTTEEDNQSHIRIVKPFDLPESLVVIVVNGVESLHIADSKTYPLHADEDEEATWHDINTGIMNRGSRNTLVRFNLGDGVIALGQSALGELKTTPINNTSLTALNPNREDDRKALEEVQLLHAIAQKVPSVIKADSNPDVYWFVVSQIKPVIDAYGKNSSAEAEALSLLKKAIMDIAQAFVKAYDNKTIVAVVTNDGREAPQTRSVTLQRQKRDTNDKVCITYSM